MGERISFNVNAELYENQFGDLAIRFPGQKVYRNVGVGGGARFQRDAARMLEQGEHPSEWAEMPAHELLYGKGWHCICLMGYLEGDTEKPAVELEVESEEMGGLAKEYLSDAISRH